MNRQYAKRAKCMVGAQCSATIMHGVLGSSCTRASLSRDLGSNGGWTGYIPSCVGNLTNLARVSFYNTGVVGSFPEDFCRLKKLREISLGTKLGGNLPSCLGNLPSLTFLYLALSNFDGPIPTSLCNLTNLAYLNLGGNQMSGAIPSCFSKLPSLTYLNVGTNFLAGPLPQSFSNPALQLSIDRNFFSGSPQVAFANGSSVCPALYNLNCFESSAGCAAAAAGQQRTAADCAAFCNSTSAAGPCGGHGRCDILNSAPVCICNPGFVAKNSSGAATCAPGAMARLAFPFDIPPGQCLSLHLLLMHAPPCLCDLVMQNKSAQCWFSDSLF
eukprot:jgi/Mesen1/7116/ME000369S06458